MPSFDIVSEVDLQEVDNAVNQARKEITTRFDFKGSKATIEFQKEESIILTAEDATRLKSLREIMVGRLSRRNVDLRNIEHKDPEISPLGHARQTLLLKQGIEGDKAKEIVAFIKSAGLKVQAAIQERQIRVTGKKRDDLQEVIQTLGGHDFKLSLAFQNFRE
ncbi:MAG: YajQ family cyclic di-GMP-binding protein [Chthoniobacterales bacterium]